VQRGKAACAMAGNDVSNENLPGSGAYPGQEVTVEQSMFRVLLLNDDATPMQFVVQVLVDIFKKTPEDAERLMLAIHHTGKAACGVYTQYDAEGLIGRVAELASQNRHPLRCLVEANLAMEPVAYDIPPALREWRVLTHQGSLGDLPAIVLEAGGGGTRQSWALVQKRLAERTLVVSYDRAGLGRNTEWADDVGAAGVASRLATLLARAAIPPSYLLVGHSLGGLFVQYYAVTHPGDVAGLVLVDPTPAQDLTDPSLEHLRGWGDRAVAHIG
jgi:ATP-dependent Clp protease adaptor protein ClpS